MSIDAIRPGSSDRFYLRIAGFGIILTAAVIQAVVIGIAWRNYPGSACDDLSWGKQIACLHPFAYRTGVLAFTGWCVGGIALLLGRYFIPYISFLLPAAVVAGSIWAELAFFQESGIAFWPPDAMTASKIMIFAEPFSVLALMFIGPAAGAWLVGYAARRRRRQAQLHHASVDAFD
jgi:hypothetical protein